MKRLTPPGVFVENSYVQPVSSASIQFVMDFKHFEMNWNVSGSHGKLTWTQLRSLPVCLDTHNVQGKCQAFHTFNLILVFERGIMISNTISTSFDIKIAISITSLPI